MDIFDVINSGNADMVRSYINSGNDINARYGRGAEWISSFTPLMLAAMKWEAETVEILLDAKADVNALNEFGQTALMVMLAQLAIKFDELMLVPSLPSRVVKIAMKLIDLKTDVNIRDKHGDTALILACGLPPFFLGTGEIVAALLAARADVTLKNNKGVSALDIARKFKNEPVARMLKGAPSLGPVSGRGGVGKLKTAMAIDSEQERIDEIHIFVHNGASASDGLTIVKSLRPDCLAQEKNPKIIVHSVSGEWPSEMLPYAVGNLMKQGISLSETNCLVENGSAFGKNIYVVYLKSEAVTRQSKHPRSANTAKRVLITVLVFTVVGGFYFGVLKPIIENHNLSIGLFNAVDSHDTNFIESYIRNKHDVNIKNQAGDTVLICAASNNSADIVKLLIAAKADVNTGGSGGKTALACAVLNDNADLVKSLIDAKADPNEKDQDGKTALISAICYYLFDQPTKKYPAVDIAKLLLDAGVDVNAKDNNGMTASMYVAERLINDFATNPFADAFPDIVSRSSYRDIATLLKRAGSTDIYVAAASGDATYVTTYINSDKKYPYFKHTIAIAAIFAAQNGNTNIVKSLIDSGADINLMGERGLLALMFAASNLHEDTVKLLIASGADINWKDNQGKTLLMHASYFGRPQIVKFLIAAGADVNSGSEGQRAINYAHMGGDVDGITERLLLAAGAED